MGDSGISEALTCLWALLAGRCRLANTLYWKAHVRVDQDPPGFRWLFLIVDFGVLGTAHRGFGGLILDVIKNKALCYLRDLHKCKKEKK